jgi:hypothetical protein
MDIIKIILAASVYILLVASNLAWAAVRTEPSKGASYLFIVVAVLGGIIALLGIILAFRGVKSSAEVSIKIPGVGTFKFNKVGQGVVLAIIGAIILVSALYLYPTTTTKTVTETTIIEGEDGTRTIHRSEAF